MARNIFIILRNKCGSTQEQMNQKCNLCSNSWCRYENGVKLKSHRVAKKIASALKINPNLLYPYVEKRECSFLEQARDYNIKNPFVKGIAESIVQAISNNNDSGDEGL